MHHKNRVGRKDAENNAPPQALASPFALRATARQAGVRRGRPRTVPEPEAKELFSAQSPTDFEEDPHIAVGAVAATQNIVVILLSISALGLGREAFTDKAMHWHSVLPAE
jgi:hypothetical protein